MKVEELKDLLAEAIDDSLDAGWNSRICAGYIISWLNDAGLCIKPKDDQAIAIDPGSNEWLAQSPQFHPGDIA